MNHRSMLLGAALCAAVSLPATAHAAAGESSFTPTSFLLPIQSIVLTYVDPSGGSAWQGGGPVFSCPDSTDGGASEAGAPDGGGSGAEPPTCWVDMADSSALAALFSQSANVPPGTYNTIAVNNCGQSGAFTAKLEGSVSIGGTTYYTSSAPSAPLSVNAGDLDYVSINYSGCSTNVPLVQPVTVAAGDSLEVSAYFSLNDLSWVLGNFSPGLGGCADATAGQSSVCAGLPALIASVNSAPPNLASYLITEDVTDLTASKAGGQVMLLEQGGAAFAGFLRRYYSETSVAPSVSYDVPLRSVVMLASDGGAGDDAGGDGGVSDDGAASAPVCSLTAYGDPATDPSKYRVSFPAFELASHVGTLMTANGASSLPYRAVQR